MKPQNEAVLALLRERGAVGLTPAEAREAVGTDRLAARIWELREDGYDIERRGYLTPSHKVVARYFLHETTQLTAFDTQRDARPGSAPVLAGALPSGGRRATTAAAPGGSR